MLAASVDPSIVVPPLEVWATASEEQSWESTSMGSSCRESILQTKNMGIRIQSVKTAKTTSNKHDSGKTDLYKKGSMSPDTQRLLTSFVDFVFQHEFD